jgi:hypothetical protein
MFLGFLLCCLFLLVGIAVSLLLRPWLPQSLAGWLAGAFVLGTGATGTLLYLLAIAGVPITRATVWSLAVVALLSLFARMRALRDVLLTRTRTSRATLVLLALPFAFVLYATWDLPIGDYDGRATWMPKTAAIAHEHSIAGPFFHGERGLNLHNHYPLLLPLDTAAMLLLAETDDVHIVRLLYLLIPFAFLLCACELARERVGNSASILAAAAWLPPWIVASEGGAGSAYADLTAAAFFGLAVLSAADDEEPRRARSIGIWLAFLILTKNEGLFLTVVLIGTLIVCGRVRRVSLAALLAIAPLLAVVTLSLWRASVPYAYDHRYHEEAKLLLEKLPRLGHALRAFCAHAGSIANWGFVWPAVVAASVWNLARKRDLVTILAVFGAALAYVLSYTVTTWDIDELAGVSAHRLLTHLLVPGFFIVATSVHDFLRYDRTHDADPQRR